ncbi:MAG: ribosome biogenesis factor YjgA [Lautropia sp.]|nr:ribosome biogenesis factor YjgA [Lautropia sp.]
MKTAHDDEAFDAQDNEDIPLSKTRRKQQMHALQTLGQRLVELAPQRLDRIRAVLPENLLQAVEEARRIKSHEGRRRQLQFIGKLMRSVDAQAIEAVLAIDDERHHGAVHVMHRAEHWRDGLIDDSLSLTDFIAQYPAAAQAGLPSLLSKARKEKTAGKPPRQQRQLYRVLHQILFDAIMPPLPSASTGDTDGTGIPGAEHGL